MAVIAPPAAVHLPLVAAYLDARMAQAEAMLVRTLDGKGDHIADPTRPLAEAAAAAAAAGVLLPDQQLARRYHLAPPTLDLLWLICAPSPPEWSCASPLVTSLARAVVSSLLSSTEPSASVAVAS